MGAWQSESKTHVASMSDGDFFSSEKSVTIAQATTVRVELVDGMGNTRVLKKGIELLEGEIIDAAAINKNALRSFIDKEIQNAKEQDVLFSLHLKATMMKVSDPIIFGHVVAVFFEDVFTKHATLFKELGVNPNNGLGDVYSKITKFR